MNEQELDRLQAWLRGRVRLLDSDREWVAARADRDREWLASRVAAIRQRVPSCGNPPVHQNADR